MEVCIDSVDSAIAAEKGGATRLELCANLFEGGTTPSLGMLQVVKANCNLPVFVLIRPRGGDFLYSDLDLKVMRHDIQIFKSHGADGYVLGILNREGEVDATRCQELLSLCRPLPVTFHRAFDMCASPMESLETIISLGFDRLLTSGQESSALEGAPLIRKLVEKAHDRIVIMPGGGINERNLERILKETKAHEFHCSARSTEESGMVFRKSGVFMGATLRPPEFALKYTNENTVKKLRRISEKR